MTDPFVEEPNEQPMSRAMPETTTTAPDASTRETEPVRQAVVPRHVCPYCGFQYPDGTDPCPRCTMEDTPATRQATKARIGPWYVLQTRNPAAPGMKYATLVALIHREQVTARSIVRGPTTHQLWRYAAHVRGISREFGLCYSCGGAIERTVSLCPQCQRSQDPPVDPDVLVESRTNGSAVDGGAIEVPSHAARMGELQRQRGQGSNGAMSAAKFRTELPRRSDGRVVSAMGLAAALQEGPEAAAPASPRRRGMRLVLLLLVLVAGGAALLWLRPDYRARSIDWTQRSWTAVKDRISAIEWPKAAPQAPLAPTIQDSVRDTPRITAPVTAPASMPAMPSIELAKGANTPDPEPPAPQAVNPEPSKQAPVGSPLEQARTLWRQAIDAEASRDFASAARLYGQIKDLPREAWPAGLDLRLKRAQREAGQTKIE